MPYATKHTVSSWAILGIVAILPLTTLAGEPATEPAWQTLVNDAHAQTGVWSCASTACHGGLKAERRAPRTTGGELEIWLSADPHARASSILAGEAFEKILVRLQWAKSNSDAAHSPQVLNAAGIRECMQCHNPAGVANRWDGAAKHGANTLAIDCETCHGPAEKWLNTHPHADWNRTAAQTAGFRDLKQLLLRGRTCAQCHVGDERHDMNHDMIAAGHPPLRFELSSSLAALPKHWNDRQERTLTNQRELKLWLAGQLANYDASLGLLESRLRRVTAATEDRPQAPWPELAEYSCAACHQPLLPLSNERRGEGTNITLAFPGLAPVANPLVATGWNQGFVESIITGREATNSPARTQLAQEIGTLRTALETGDFTHTNELAWADHVHNLRHGNATQLGVRSLSGELLQQLEREPVAQPLARLALRDPLKSAEQAAHAYALLVAALQSQYDEAAKAGRSTGLTPPPELRAMRERLAPSANRPFGSASASNGAAALDDRFTEQAARVLRAVESAESP